MKAFVVLFVILAFASGARADVNYDLGKKLAKRQANQGQTQPDNPPAQSPAPPTDPALAATRQNIADLRTDLDALARSANAQAGAEQRIALLNHLSAAAQGKKAEPASVRKIAGRLIRAASGNKDLSAHNTQFASDLHALFNSAHLSAAQTAALLGEVKKILTDAGVLADDADYVVNDLKQIAAETQ